MILEPYEAFQLRSARGQVVPVVAVHAVTPEGLTYSPTPNGPLIGSAKLPVVTTAWENIDLESLRQYRALKGPADDALNGKSTTLQVGPHFDDLDVAMEEIRRHAPSVNVRYRDGRRDSVDFSSTSPDELSDLNRSASGWSMQEADKQEAMQAWENAIQTLETVAYRRDVILLKNRLDRGIWAMREITPQSSTYHANSARAIYELVSHGSE